MPFDGATRAAECLFILNNAGSLLLFVVRFSFFLLELFLRVWALFYHWADETRRTAPGGRQRVTTRAAHSDVHASFVRPIETLRDLNFVALFIRAHSFIVAWPAGCSRASNVFLGQ